MKYFVLFMVLCAVFSSAFCTNVNNDGQPGCKTAQEMTIKKFKNNWDPTRYWECIAIQTPGSEVQCPDGEAFDDTKKNCVDWSDWTWTPPQNPPSFP